MNFWDVERHEQNIAAVTPEGISLTYAALAVKADVFAENLPDRKTVGIIQCQNTLETLIAYIGCLRHHHVAILIGKETAADTLTEAFNVDWLMQADGEISVFDKTKKNIDSRVAILLSTSGSTGSPKQVVLSYENLQANAASIAEYLELSPDEKPITTLPFQYSYGLSVINSHLLAGSTMLLTEKAIITREFWEFFRKEKATSMAGVPTTYEMFVRLKLDTMQLDSLKTLTQAGGKLQVDKVQHFHQLARQQGWRFFVMYGQTEATARMSYLPLDVVEHYPQSIGIAIPGGKFWLEDESGHKITDMNTPGELVYQGPNVMLGYASNASEIERFEDNAVLHTGDLAVAVDNEVFQITGRKKRIIKLHGLRIALDELEQLFSQHSLEVLCTGTDHNLVIACLPSQNVDVLKQFLEDYTEIKPMQVKFLVMENWPVTESGKIAYDKLINLA